MVCQIARAGSRRRASHSDWVNPDDIGTAMATQLLLR